MPEYQTHPSAVNGQAPDTSGLASGDNDAPRFEWGNVGVEIIPGHGTTIQRGAEYHTAPTADPVSGYTFKTKQGSPVPNGEPRMTDLVTIQGIDIEVGQALRDGFLPRDFSKGPIHSPQDAPRREPEVANEVIQNEPSEPHDAVTDAFQTQTLPRVSPQAMELLLDGVRTGEFSELTDDLFQLEGQLPPGGLDDIRDAYAAKVTAATGLTESELEEVWQGDPEAFTRAAQEMLKTGSTAAFQTLAHNASEPDYSPLSNDEALEIWRSPDILPALVEAGVEPSFENGELIVAIPGKGRFTWADAVSKGHLGVSRG